jgi:transposase
LYRVELSEEQQRELQRRTREPGIRPRTRDRLEMVRLSHSGRSVPQIARHLGISEQRVRHWIKTFLANGFEALTDRPPVGRTSRLTPALREAVRQELEKGDRTWTASQLAEWIEQQFGVRVSAAHLRRFRRRWQLSYKRTARSLRHKQKPEEVAAKKAELETLEQQGEEGLIDLYQSDEVGFALTLPVCYSWTLVGRRLTVPYEAPQGRRVNGIGAYCTHGVEAGRFVYELCASLPKSKAKQPRKSPQEQAATHDLQAEQVGVIDGERFVQFVWTVAGRPAIYPDGWQRERPLVLVVDNYSVHQGERVQQEQAAFAAAGITLFYLPSYSPELSGIEPIWQDVKHHDMTQRSYDLLGALFRGVDEALARKAEDLMTARIKTDHPLRAAA